MDTTYRLIITFLPISKVCSSQTDLLVKQIKSCDINNLEEIRLGIELQYPGSKRSIYLPKNWTGNLEGELISLRAKTTDNSRIFF